MTEDETRKKIAELQTKINTLRSQGRDMYNNKSFECKNPWIEANKLEEELKHLMSVSQIDNRGITNF